MNISTLCINSIQNEGHIQCEMRCSKIIFKHTRTLSKQGSARDLQKHETGGNKSIVVNVKEERKRKNIHRHSVSMRERERERETERERVKYLIWNTLQTGNNMGTSFPDGLFTMRY